MIAKTLRNRSVLGDFIPHTQETVDGKKRRKSQDPIADYFPAVVPVELWTAVQTRLSTVQAKGRHANKPVSNVFAGLLRCALCGGTTTRTAGRTDRPTSGYLICATANGGRGSSGCKRLPVPYADVLETFTRQLSRTLADAPRGADTADMEQQAEGLALAIDAYETDERDLVEELLQVGHTSARATLRQKLTELGTEKDKLATALRDLLERRDAMTAKWVAARLKAVEATMRGKGGAVDPAEANAALRAAFARIDLDALQGRIRLYWHHAPDDPQEVRFPSRWVFANSDQGTA